MWNQRERSNINIKLVLFYVTAIIASGFLSTIAYSLPNNGLIQQGSGKISSIDIKTLQIFQKSERMLINWREFNIGINEKVKLIQPDRYSLAIIRIDGSEPSIIAGQLSSNGIIFLINPNGIIFSQDARLDVGGLLSSTNDIDADKQLFDNSDFGLVGKSRAGIENHGTIKTLNGDISLVSHHIINTGVLSSPSGTVKLTFGTDIFLQQRFRVNLSPIGFIDQARGQSDSWIENSGIIRAARAEFSTSGEIKNSGTIDVKSVENSGTETISLGASLVTGGGTGNIIFQNAGTLQQYLMKAFPIRVLLIAKASGFNRKGRTLVIV